MVWRCTPLQAQLAACRGGLSSGPAATVVKSAVSFESRMTQLIQPQCAGAAAIDRRTTWPAAPFAFTVW